MFIHIRKFNKLVRHASTLDNIPRRENIYSTYIFLHHRLICIKKHAIFFKGMMVIDGTFKSMMNARFNDDKYEIYIEDSTHIRIQWKKSYDKIKEITKSE